MNKNFHLTAIILFTFFSLTLRAQSVLEWRGAGRTGIYPEQGLMKSWPAAGPALLWSALELPSGWSSVSISHNSIFLTGKKDDQDVVTALNMDGKVKWQTPYGRSWNQSFPESRCTPTIDNNKLYVTSGLGDAACLDAESGNIIWSLKASEQFEGTFGMWGIAESPIILGNKMFYSPGGKKTTMVALDKETGKTIWQSESLGDNPSYSTPILIEYAGQKQIVNVSEEFIYAVSPEDGKILWKFPFGQYASDGTNINTNSPLYSDGKIFVSDGYNHSNVMLQLSPDGHSVSLVWSNGVLDTHHGGYVKVGEYIYGSNWIHNGMGNWVCLEWNTGKTMYETAWYNKGPVISDGEMLYCQEEKTGNIALVKADPTKFEVTSTFKIPFGKGPFWAHPVICNGVLYLRHGSALMAYKIKD
ncbi:MAG: PQQ-binding-like beta-propeller repeat protein [Bacteroidales bacterium]